MHLLAWLRWSLLALLIVNNCDGTAPGLDPTVDDILTDLTPLTHFRAHGTGRFSPLDGHLTTTFDLNEVVYGLFTVRRLVLDFLSAARDTAKTMASHMTNHSASSPFGLKSAVPIAYELVKRVNRSLDLNNDVRMVIGAILPPDHTTPGLTDFINPAAMLRVTRQIIAGLVAGGAALVSAEVASLFSGSDYSSEAISDLETNQGRLLAALKKEHQRTEDNSLELHKAVKWANDQVESLYSISSWDQRLIMLSTLVATVENHNAVVISGINSLLQHHRLPPHLVRPKEITKQLEVLAEHAKAKGLECLYTTPLQVFHAETIPIPFQNGTVRAVTNIPLSPLNQRFNFLELLPVPIRIDSNHTRQITVSTPDRFLAVSLDQLQSTFVSLRDLDQCRPLGGDLLCKGNPVLSRNPHASCAKALYFDDHRDAIATCTFSTVPAVAGAWRIALGEYAVFLPKPEVLTVTCTTQRSDNDRLFTASFVGLKKLSLPPHCRAYCSSFQIQEFESLLPVKAPVSVDATMLTEALVLEVEDEHNTVFKDTLSAAVPKPYSDPSLLHVRHTAPLQWWVKVLIGCGAAALGAVMALSAVLFCRYRSRTTEARVQINMTSDDDHELKPMAPLGQIE